MAAEPQAELEVAADDVAPRRLSVEMGMEEPIVRDQAVADASVSWTSGRVSLKNAWSAPS